MPLSTLAFTIDATGVHAPSYAEIYSSLQDQIRSIFGSDIAVTPDTKDGQMLAVFAQAIYDSNQNAIALYNYMRPSFSIGAPLSSLVKINGISRQNPTNSAANGNVIGVSGTTINNGVVEDQNGNKWNLPDQVVIPDAGIIEVTVVAQQPGAIIAPAGSINKISTPVLGWQSFLSVTDSLPGTPVESDAALRRRQSSAASLPTNSNLAGILSALEALDGVTRVRVYENDTGAPDANGLVAHSAAVVIEGGDLRDIAETIGQKKAPGCNLNGTTTQSYSDPLTGQEYDIKFYVLQTQAVVVTVTVKSLDGWNDSVSAEIQQSVSDYISGLDIGQAVQFTRVYPPAYLNGGPNRLTYEITALTVNGAALDVAVAFNKVALCPVASVTIVVAP